MITAKLIDNIWATRKSELLNGYKLMVVEVIGGADAGKRLVAVDVISAGIGDRVLVTLGSSARKMFEDDNIRIIDEDCCFEE